MWTQLLSFFASNLLYFALRLEKNTTFPSPLRAAEEQECFRRMAEGDAGARDRLIEHNLRLVAHVVKKYSGGQSDTDELLSIGTMGLMKAVSTFSYEKGTRFATYASKCIDNAILSKRLFQVLMRQRSFKVMHGIISAGKYKKSRGRVNPSVSIPVWILWLFLTSFQDGLRNSVHQFQFLLDRAMELIYVLHHIIRMKCCRTSIKQRLFFRCFRIVNDYFDKPPSFAG